MRAFSLYSLGLALLLALMPLQAPAGEKEALKQYVEENTLKLVDRLEGIRDVYQDDREAFYEQMNEALEGFVAFRRIAGRVMGQHGRQATEEQRDQFVRAFRRSLYDAYGGAMLDTGEFSLDVTGVQLNERNENRATVNLRVTTEGGDRYGVAYSMYRADADSQWQMENVIVEGINIGLAFRDRFSQEMEKHGSVADVIDNWSADVADLNGLEDAVDDPEDG